MNEENINKNSYPDLRYNGRIFPIWILKNFAKYKLPEIIIKENDDACNKQTKEQLKKYQEFIASYLDYKSPYHDILIYHGLGSGKSATTINLYNALYNTTSSWNVFLLIPAALSSTWDVQLKKWLQTEDFEHRFSHITFVNYNSPFADTDFMDKIRKTDTTLKNMFIIEECHNFIRNVYSNVTSKKGTRASKIYDYIIQNKKEDPKTRVVALSGTPGINKPFELALLFNLLRPDIFPKSEVLFNQHFLSNGITPTINPKTKNMFQRRIMGLVSYYIGATPDLYASESSEFIDVQMGQYQTNIYNYYEDIENKMKLKARSLNKMTETYSIYTRQASNFVFPHINQDVTGESRPRPSKYKISDKEMEQYLRTKDTDKIKEAAASSSNLFLKDVQKFVDSFDLHIKNIYDEEINNPHNITHDIQEFNKYDSYNEWFEKSQTKSNTIKELWKCSSKYINVIFNTFKSPGPVLIYTNFVIAEGLQIFKIYLKYFGFGSFKDKNTKDFFRYAEFHNAISKEERQKSIEIEITKENVYGKDIKIMLFSPAGAEGISLYNLRQVHIIEPYYHEVRIKQIIGRAVRICSHKHLPIKERHVDVFRYRSVKYNYNIKETSEGQITKKEKILITDPMKLKTIDQEIEDIARNKNNLLQSFLDSIKEVAIDCELFKNHNMFGQKYRCFKFNEISLFDKNIGPAYKDDIIEDYKIENGSNSTKSITIRVKAVKIKGIIDETLNVIEDYWYNHDSGTVYDYELHYPIGKVKMNKDDIPTKINKDVYVIDTIPIPIIQKIK